MSGGTKARDAEFAAFMSQAGPALLRTAWLLTGDHHRAQELTQAALVKTYVAWPRVRPGEALAYTRRVLVNQRTDTWRSTRKEVTTDAVPEVAPALTRDETATADNRDLVVRLLKRLPEQQRKVVVLRYYTDLSEQATADALGISVGAVKSAASRGLAALRRGLPTPPDGDDPDLDLATGSGADQTCEPREGSNR
ncbi:SigE family RNA polymerase sigma factor [Humibacillus sp. DSM 29435]|uniref:SigE family RNA polymerase sigma factor n=1 Tax=Humibacillus sp. DSM 29435 TaxID=1869167 RepID=UPI0009F22D1B|nr:SigE family RNA polymerase sigma factor [Humibacillus sp. DSM 29435]